MQIDPDFQDRIDQLILQSQLMWAAAVAALLFLGLLAYRLRGRMQDPDEPVPGGLVARLRHFNDSSSAIASMEFLMVFFPFLIIVMTVWQLAFMFNAQIHVGYAAYAAARSASVVIPEDLQREAEYQVKKLSDASSGNQQDVPKWKRIRRAAIPGLIGISPGDEGDAAGVVGMLLANQLVQESSLNINSFQLDPQAFAARMTLMTAHYGTEGILSGNRTARGAVKAAYADQVTKVLINGQDHTKALNLSGADTVAVTVKYIFWLNVPYVGRMIEATMQGWINPLTGKPWFNNPFPSMEMTETIHMKIWTRKRAVEPC
jgi:hypothetical protein